MEIYFSFCQSICIHSQSDGYLPVNDGRKTGQHIWFDCTRNDDKQLLLMDVSDAHIFVNNKRTVGFYYSEYIEKNSLNKLNLFNITRLGCISIFKS